MKNITCIIILILGLLSPNETSAQVVDELNGTPFGSTLIKLDSSNFIVQLKTELDSAIICFNLRKKKTPFNFTDRWKLVYYVYTGYEEHHTIGGTEHVDFADIYQSNNESMFLTGNEIFKEFNISDTILENAYSKEFRIGHTFQFHANTFLDISDKYIGNWIPIISKDNHLIIYFVSNYPAGNDHSWSREYIYYFEKVTI